jgi:hypothetical protein
MFRHAQYSHDNPLPRGTFRDRACSNGDPQGLAALAGVVDEVVLQIYQGPRVIPGYADYLAKLDRLKIPFRIGLLQGGERRMPRQLPSNPWFRGFVIFLRNPRMGVSTSPMKSARGD